MSISRRKNTKTKQNSNLKIDFDLEKYLLKAKKKYLLPVILVHCSDNPGIVRIVLSVHLPFSCFSLIFNQSCFLRFQFMYALAQENENK